MPLNVLERIAVDEAPPRPEAKAAEIHRELGDIRGAVPVYEIARALDIEEVEAVPTKAFEGILITTAERDFGVIGVNTYSSPQRRRFSVAHELGHFLCDWHAPTSPGKFTCTRRDMTAPTGEDRHKRQEEEANLFAIELLAPARLIAPYLRRLPELEHVLDIHRSLEISRAAAARRYAALHPRKVAALFAKSGAFSCIERSQTFPFLPLERGERLPPLPRVRAGEILSDVTEVDPEAWKVDLSRCELACQVLVQENDYTTILLYLEV